MREPLINLNSCQFTIKFLNLSTFAVTKRSCLRTSVIRFQGTDQKLYPNIIFQVHCPRFLLIMDTKQMSKEAALIEGVYYKLDVQISENKSKFIDKLTSTVDKLNPLPAMQLREKLL